MFGRSLLTLLGIASLGWIIYVIITIGSNNSSPTPDLIFSERDKTVAIVHRVDEIQFNHSDYAFIQEHPFYLQVLEHPERVQHFFFSSGRQLMVLERSKPWTFEIISKFTDKMGIGANLKGSKSIHLSNGWVGQFHGKFLVLAQGFEPTYESKPLVQWNFVDRKASTSMIKPNEKGEYIIENAYSIGKAQVKYISQSAIGKLPLVDDADFFAQIVPSNFATYTFYETNYAKNLFGAHPFFEFMDHGVVELEKEGGYVYLMDYAPGQEPLAILNNYLNADDFASKRTQFTKLPLPFHQENQWYLEVFNGYAIVSSESNLIDQIIGSYESGNTLAQDSKKMEDLFENTPKRVSYRKITSTEHITKSCLSTSIHTVIEQRSISETNGNTDEIPPLRIDGTITALIPIQGTHSLFVFTDAPSVHLVMKNDLIWTVPLDGELIGDPLLINNTQQLAFSTSNSIHLLNMAGNESKGFPVTGRLQSAPEQLNGQGGMFLSVIMDNQLIAFSNNGTRLMALGTGMNGNCRLLATTKKGAQVVHIVNDRTWKSIQLKKKIVLQNTELGNGDWYLSRLSNNVLPVGMQKNKFYRVGENGKTSSLIGNAQEVVRVQNTNNQQLFFVVQQHVIHVINGDGIYLTHFETRLNNIDDAYYYRTAGGKIVVGLLDGIANNVYIYSVQGNEVSKNAYQGSGKIVLHRTGDGSTQLISGSNGYLLRYALDLN